MRLRPELVRDILMTVEEYLPDREDEIVWPAYASEEELKYHRFILMEGGLLAGNYVSSFGNAYDVLVERLTLQGHEAVDALRNESVFNEVQKALSARNLVSVSLDVLIQMAKKVLKDIIGGD